MPAVPVFPSPCLYSRAHVLPAAPCHPGRAAGVASELGNQLRPDGDHPDEKCDRRQRRSLFHEYLQHADLLIRNIRRTLFLFCSDLSRGRLSISLKDDLIVNWMARAACRAAVRLAQLRIGSTSPPRRIPLTE